MNKPLSLTDIQKMRFECGAVVYNTNNYAFAIVLDGNRGSDSDPSSLVIEQRHGCGRKTLMHTPPNRALIPIGRHIDFEILLSKLPKGCGNDG